MHVPPFLQSQAPSHPFELQIHIWAAIRSHMMQAGHSFKGTLMSQRLVRENDSDEHYTVPINFDCSQDILDILVKAIYARKTDLTADNVKDILMLADFLQASPQTTVESKPKSRSVQAEESRDYYRMPLWSPFHTFYVLRAFVDSFNTHMTIFLQADWLTKTVLQHIKAETLDEEPMRMFRIGQRFHSAELTDDAIASVAKRGRKDIEELLCESTDDSLRDERNLLTCCAEDLTFAEVGFHQVNSRSC